MMMRFWEEFQRIERVGNDQTNLLVDPVSIQVVLHDEAHSVYMEGEARKAATGRYYVDFDTSLLLPGNTYTIYWRFEPIANVVQVKRQELHWDTQFTNDLDGYCLIHGTETDAVGMPLYKKRVIIVQYDDYAVKDRIVSKVETFTDAQGKWTFMAKWGHLYQAIKDNREAKTFLVPEKHVEDYDLLAIYQKELFQTDKFGNPVDGKNLTSTLNRLYLGGSQDGIY